jgi:hypothetical protein
MAGRIQCRLINLMKSFKYPWHQVKGMRKKEVKLERDIEDIKKKERIIIKELDQELNKGKVAEQERKFSVKHFTFADFCQSAIGVGVFGLQTIVNPDIWSFISDLDIKAIILLHIFFIICFFVALNYEFRKDFSFDIVFLRNLLKRVFFIYISVLITVAIILIVVEKLSLSMQNYDVLKNVIIAQSAGLVGAITFSFLRK